MEFSEVMSTTFAARDFTDEHISDDQLYTILDNARFAPSGGNRQGWKVILVRDTQVKKQLGELCWPAMRIAAAQMKAGETYWQSVEPTSVDIKSAADDESLPIAIPMFKNLGEVPVVCIITVDLRVVASMDMHLDRIGVVSGASIYPFAWSVLLSARNEGLGGALTTLIASAEPKVQKLLGLETHDAVAAMLTMGKPVKQITKLSRKPVEEFTFINHTSGQALTRP